MFKADNISIKIRSKYIVKKSSLHIPESTTAIFIGANGSGKTTTLRGITGIIPLSEGTTSLHEKKRHQTLGLSLGSDYLPPKVTIKDFFSFTGDPTLKDHSEELLESCNMAQYKKRLIGKLSMGMKQKVAICSALRYQPENIILDEPHNGLDPESIEWLNGVINQSKHQGASILLSSHLLKEVADIGDMAYQMKDQKITEVSWPPLQSSFQKLFVVEVDDGIGMSAFLEKSQVQYRLLDEHRIEVYGSVRDVLSVGYENNIFIKDICFP